MDTDDSETTTVERRSRTHQRSDGTPSVRTDGGEDRSATDGEVLVRTRPTVKPTLARLATSLLIGVLTIAILFLAPGLVGGPEQANVALLIVQIVVVVAVARLLYEYVILRRTRYVVTGNVVRRHFSLLGRTKTREVPFQLLRSTERQQNRFEYLLGVGSIVLNQGLGDLRLQAVPDHDDVYRDIRERADASVETRTSAAV